MKKLVLLILLSVLSLRGQDFNYAEALQKSMFFYECQRSGFLPADNRVTWRADSGLSDGMDVGHDLTGGWYDAGDHVKFGFPLAFSATALAWGAIDFKQGYVDAGQLQQLKKNLRFVNDYFIRCHTAPNELYGQVGNGGTDHAWWGSAEVMRMARPSYKIDASKPGSDLAGETAAAMAAASIVFATDDPTYAATLRRHAIELYKFADNYRGKYTVGIPDAAGYYNSWSGYNDELVWAAIWLYRATNDPAYLAKAESYYQNLGTEPQSTTKSYRWTIAWDDKSYGCYALLAKLTGKEQYKADAERYLDYWTDGVDGQRIGYTPGGLAWLDQWGSLRYAANTAFVALYYYDAATTTAKGSKYYNFAAKQIRYMLGANPLKRSFVCGFGANPPRNPHHRTAHGAWANNLGNSPDDSRHILYGALVGGPGRTDNYTDSRNDYVSNEVATDYNALFSGALAKLTDDFGGTPLANFPVAETPVGEYVVEARQNSMSSNFMEVAVWVHNRTAWPARIPQNIKFRIFVNISEGIAAGFNASSYTVATNNGGSVSVTPLQVWDAAQKIYFTEVAFKSNVVIWPGGQGESAEEAQIRIGLTPTAPAGAWDRMNDYSLKGVDSTLKATSAIPLYVDGVLASGTPPGPGVNVPVTGVSVTPETATFNAGATYVLTARVSPANATDPSVRWTTSDATVATVSASGVVSGLALGSATITATTVDGNFTDTTIVTVVEGSSLAVTPTPISLSSSAGTATANVTSNISWTASGDKTWLSVTPATGTNNGVITVSATANTAATARTGTVTVNGGGLTRTITVTQAGATQTNFLTVAPTSLSLGAAAGFRTVSVTSNVSWTATGNQTWLSLANANGANNGVFTVGATAYTGSTARSGTVTVSGGGLSQTITVTQDPNEPSVLTVTPTSLSMPAAAGTVIANVISNVTWTVSGDQTWFNVTNSSRNGGGTVIVNATANTATTARTGTVTVSGGGLTRTITVTQAGSGGPGPTIVTIPFVKDGAGEFVYFTTGSINFINSWNMLLVEINGVNLTNRWVAGGALPARVNGGYTIRYVGQFAWSHFEAK